MNIVSWNPISELENLFTRVGPLSSAQVGQPGWLPAADISETNDAYHIKVELPSVTGEDISVTVQDGVLRISGERKSEEVPQGRRHLIERRFGKFSRSFRLPKEVAEDGIAASAKHGLLHITAKKRQEKAPCSIEVEMH